MEKRKKKISRIYIGAGCITVLILLGVVIHGVKQFTAENADTKKGIEYIQSKENEEVKVIEQKIASLEAKDPASGDTERSLKDRFSGAVVMGDSISSGFSEYDVLNASSVVAKRLVALLIDETRYCMPHSSHLPHCCSMPAHHHHPQFRSILLWRGLPSWQNWSTLKKPVVQGVSLKELARASALGD